MVMKKGRQGFGGGSIFRTSYIPVPINKTSSLGLNKALSVVIVDREQTTKQPTKSVEPRKSVSKEVRSVPKGKVKDLPELARRSWVSGNLDTEFYQIRGATRGRKSSISMFIY